MTRGDFASYCQHRAAEWFHRAMSTGNPIHRSIALEFAEGYYRNARQLMGVE
jgi:hypothetical protein